jgi:hypothetical protein
MNVAATIGVATDAIGYDCVGVCPVALAQLAVPAKNPENARSAKTIFAVVSHNKRHQA